MPTPSLWERLRRARIVQVVLVYLGATWVVLQLVDTLVGLLSLPAWVGPTAVVLLGIGLLVVTATAWVQSVPSTTAGEVAGDLPTDWEVAPGDVLTSLRAGRIPHLTWGRAILGGVVALSLLFGFAGAYVLVTGRSVPGFGPTEAGADEAAAGIAVLPFSVTGGGELDMWREGMVDVLSTNLDGMGGYRTIDARTVMARWRERVGDASSPDLRTALEVAGSTGARFGLVGNLVGSPGGVRVAADVYDLSTGEKITQSYVEGGADSVLALVGRLTVGVTRELLASTGQQVIQAPRTAGITTESLEALRHYLDGEAAYRRADFAQASAAFERAIDADSTFAMAWYRLSAAYGWMEELNNEVTARASARVEALSDRLPIRERSLMTSVRRGVLEGEVAALGDLRQIASKYPDDPEAWFELGEFYRHVGIDAGVASEEDAIEVFTRAVALDPTFAPYYIHLIEAQLGSGLEEEARASFETYRRLAGPGAQPHLGLAVALFGGDPAERSAALAGLDTVAEEVIMRAAVELPWFGAIDPEDAVEFLRAGFAATGRPGLLRTSAAVLFSRGRVREGVAELSDPSYPAQTRVQSVASMELVGLTVPPALAVDTGDPTLCPDRRDPGGACLFAVGLVAAIRGDRATWGRLVALNRELATAYEEEGQGAHAKEHAGLASALEGFWALRQDGQPGEAVASLESAAVGLGGSLSFATRLGLAEAQAAVSPQAAATTLESMGSGELSGWAQVRLGRLREELGDVAGARRAYGRAAQIFEDADEDLAVAGEAREALARLGG